jgi:chemotaxis protein methyltransferase CheR
MSGLRIPEAQRLQLSTLVADAMGLHFPRGRWDDLMRGVSAARQESGFADDGEYVGWLLAAPQDRDRLQALANHLTIGETYFFRDGPLMQALGERILPGLIASRRGRDQRLRLWSAACCSGEEAYSLAILLHRLLPDLRDWNVKILATDINPRFLKKASAGKYGEWSFRDAPAWLKPHYFERTADGRHRIAPQIAGMVTFSQLNLVDDAYPSLFTDTNAMDVVLCRNVLMYFDRPRMHKVIRRLHRALVDGGWLAVSPSEASRELFPGFGCVNFQGAIVFRKGAAREEASWTPQDAQGPIAMPVEPARPASALAPVRVPEPAPAPADPMAAAQALYGEGAYEEAAALLQRSFDGQPYDPARYALLVHALANLGRLAEARSWCDRWIAAAKMDPAGHYLRAVVVLEQGDVVQARASLQRAIYLQPQLVLAHYALGNLARGQGRVEEANRHFANALRFASSRPADELLPEAEGLSAGRLAEMIAPLLAEEDGDER